MPQNTYDADSPDVAKGDLWAYGTVKPGSELEANAIASGIPAASLDIFYDRDDPTRTQGTNTTLPLAPESYDGK